MGEMIVQEPKATQIERQSGKRRKISPLDVEIMAEHYRDGLNDRQACELAGIKPDTWAQWKGRAKNNSKFEGLLQKLTASRIKSCYNGIERAGAKDWRALRELLALTDREKFGNAQSGIIAPQVNVYAQIGIDLTKALSESYSKARGAVIVDVPEVKALPPIAIVPT